MGAQQGVGGIAPEAARHGGHTRIARALCWVMAAGLLANVALGLVTESLPDGSLRTGGDARRSIGITLLGLLPARILWRLGNPHLRHLGATLGRFALRSGRHRWGR